MAIDIVVETIENSIYEAIRHKCVDEGYTPEIERFPDTGVAYDAYLAELEAIRTAMGFAIEVFNSSPQEKKGDEKLPRIVLENEGFAPGAYGMEPIPHNEWNATIEQYETIQSDNQVYHLYVSVTVVAKTIQQRRVLQSILHQALPIKNYIPLLNTSETFFIDFDTSDNMSIPNTGISEYKYRYGIPDIWLTDEKIINQVVPIQQIILNTYIQQRLGFQLVIPEPEPELPPEPEWTHLLSVAGVGLTGYYEGFMGDLDPKEYEGSTIDRVYVFDNTSHNVPIHLVGNEKLNDLDYLTVFFEGFGAVVYSYNVGPEYTFSSPEFVAWLVSKIDTDVNIRIEPALVGRPYNTTYQENLSEIHLIAADGDLTGTISAGQYLGFSGINSDDIGDDFVLITDVTFNGTITILSIAPDVGNPNYAYVNIFPMGYDPNP